MGKLIVIEGLDGSGKATQTALLARWLLGQGALARQVSFPNYQSPSSSLIKMYLAGEFGTNPGDVNAYAASAFYAVDRFASYKAEWESFYSQGGIVLADRYATSNFIYQAAKLPAGARQEFVEWQQNFEYGKLGIPKPDLVLYLDVPPKVSQALLEKRYKGDRTQRDIHEKNLAYLLECRAAALWCAGLLGWQVVPCCEGEEMRSIETIAADLTRIVRGVL